MAIGKVQIDLEARLAKFESDIGRAARVLERELARGAQASERRMQQMERQISSQMQRIEKSASRAGSAVVAFFSIRAVAGWAGQLGNVADEFSNVQAKVRLAAGENANLSQSIEQVFGVAQRTYNTLDGTAALVQRGAMALRNFGQTADDAFSNSLQLAELFNKTLVISGASSSEAAAAAVQFSQALASGRFQGDEFRSVLENNSRFAQLLADSLGVNIAQLREMSSSGKLTTTTFIDLLSKTEQVNREFAGMPMTIGRARTQLDNAFTKFIGEGDQAYGVSRSIASAMSTLAQNIGPVATGIANLGVVIAGAFAGRGLLAIKAATVSILEQSKATQVAAQIARERAAADAAAAQQSLLRARNEQISAEATAAAAAVDRQRIQATVALANAQIATIRANALRATSEIELARASQQLTAVEQARAAATAALGTARQAEVAANAQLAASNRALQAVYVATGTAGEAAAAKITIGMRAATIAQGAMTVATRAFTAALALVGGPLGIVIIGLGLLATAFANSKAQADAAATSYRSAIEAANGFRDARDKESALAALGQLHPEIARERERLATLEAQRRVPRPAHLIEGDNGLEFVTNAGMDEQIRRSRARVAELDRQIQHINGQINNNQLAWSGVAASVQTATGKYDEQNKKLEEQRAKLELERIELQSGLRARLEYEAMQQQGVKTADQLDATTRQKIDAIVKEQAAIDASRKATRGQTSDERAAAAEKRRGESASRQFQKALTDLQLSIEGPLQAAQREYNADLAKFEDLARRGKVSAEELAKAQAALERRRALVTDDMRAEVEGPQAQAQLEYNRALERYQDISKGLNLSQDTLADGEARLRREFEQTTREIARREDPAQALIEDQQFELNLQRLSNAERQTALQLRQLEGQATEKQIEDMQRLNVMFEEQQQLIEGLDAVRDGGKQFLRDWLDGSKSFKDSVLDGLDAIRERLIDMISERLMDQLLGQRGQAGGGMAGGSWIDTALGWASSFFGGGGAPSTEFASSFGNNTDWLTAGGRAIGGPVEAGRMYRVNEREKEFFQPASNGRVIPLSRMAAASASSAQSSSDARRNRPISITIPVEGQVTRRTKFQVADETARAIRQSQRNS